MPSTHAFTLIEMLIALVIITIIATFAVPSMQRYLNNAEDSVLQAQVQSAIHYAEQESTIRQRAIVLCQTNNQSTCAPNGRALMIFVDENGEGKLSSKDQLIYQRALPLNHGVLHAQFYPFYRAYLKFYPISQRKQGNGSFWFCRAKAHQPAWAISVPKIGRTRIIHPDNNGEVKDSRGKQLSCA